jgi:hypothetical protein
MNETSYTPAPKKAPKAAAQKAAAGPDAAVRAGLFVLTVLAVGYGLHQRRSPAPAAAPAPARVGALPPQGAPAAARPGAAQDPFSYASPQAEAVMDHGALSPADLEGASSLVTRWSWPGALTGFAAVQDVGSLGARYATPDGLMRRLAAWNPAAPDGRQLLYSVRRPDGVEVLLYEDQLHEAYTAAATDEAGREPAFQGTSGLGDYTTHVGQGVVYRVENPKIVVAAAPAAAASAPRPGRAQRVTRRAQARAVAGRAGSGGAVAYVSGPRNATIVGTAAAPAAAQTAPNSRIAFTGPDVPAGAGAGGSGPGTDRGRARQMTAEELQALNSDSLRSRNRPTSVRFFTAPPLFVGAPARRMAELTFADGRSETVPYDPLVFDLKGRGVQTDDRRVLFDLYGHHKDDKQQWMNDFGDGTGVLVFDADGGGKSGTSGSEVFGDRTDLSGVGRPDGFANGFEALRGLAEKAVSEGVLSRSAVDAGVLNAESLLALERAYGLRMKVGGLNKKAISLAQAGVASISLASQPTRMVENYDGRGNGLVVQPGAVFTRTDGSSGAYMNVWLVAKTGSLGLAKR